MFRSGYASRSTQPAQTTPTDHPAGHHRRSQGRGHCQLKTVCVPFVGIDGDRYTTVPDQVKMYALGYYGALLAPVDPDVLDRIVARGSPAITDDARDVNNALPGLQRQFPRADDSELLLRFMCAGPDVDRMLDREARDPSTNESAPVPGSSRVAGLVRVLARLAERDPGGEVVVERQGLRVRVRS